MSPRDPFRPVDDEARDLTRAVLTSSTHAALGVVDPDDGAPVVSRIAVAILADAPHTLVSTLSPHTTALSTGRAASLLLGEPGPKGDPLTHPRLTLQVTPEPADKDALRATWLADRPKSALYYDFTDFQMIRLEPTSGILNGGFGKAYRLSDSDLAEVLQGLSTRATS
ncbi:MAG: pyridoxamine 5-phosphate oxidase [Shimia sp.]